MTGYAIETKALVKTYGTLRKPARAVDGMSMKVPRGSIYGLLGRNSAGKTTTIRMLMGLARPEEGSAEVLGFNPAREPERVAMLARVGYVPEDKALLGLTTRKMLALNRAFYPRTWSDDLARKVVDRLELPLDTPFLKLSLGNKTKSALAVAFAQRSEVLILDEPTTGLDPVALDALLQLLVEDGTADGRTVLLSSHQLNEMEQIADHVGIMDRGRLLLEGPLDDVRAGFRRFTVTGEGLPERGPGIVTVRRERHGTQYVVERDPDQFAAHLLRQGATIVEAAPLSLHEIFLELCRRDEGGAA